MDRYSSVLGCLLGTALGDAVGIRLEGLSRRRAIKMYGSAPLEPNLIFRRGLCSDDTEHTQMVGRALALSAGKLDEFELEFSRQLKCWLLTIPAGIGLATLRSCIKLLLGFRPAQSGVFSAGNGPAMRAALIGVFAESDTELVNLINRCTRITHTDPKAEEGAFLVAKAAQLAATKPTTKPIDFLSEIVSKIKGDEMHNHMQSAIKSLYANQTPQEFAESLEWNRGISGYINQTVPAALYCWAYSPTDFRQCVENAVLLGGDTDSVAAITGAICGANLGYEKLPPKWLDRLSEWPRNIRWMEQLAEALTLSVQNKQNTNPPRMLWLSTIPRNILFAVIVLGIGLRRLLPPY